MATVQELFQPDVLGTMIETNPNANGAYLGEALFGQRKVYNLELANVLGADRVPVALKASALDTKAPIRQRPEVTEMKLDIPFFREGYTLGEQAYRELQVALQSNIQEAWKPLIRRAYDDVTDLYEGARARAEQMRMQLLSSGKVGFTSNRVPYDMDYGFKEENIIQVATANEWSKPTADVLGDLDAFFEGPALNKGITKAIMTSATLRSLRGNEGIAGALNGAVPSIRVNTENIKNYLETEYGIEIVLYDKVHKDTETGELIKFFPDGVVSFIPDGLLGDTVYSYTPEELADSEPEYQATVRNVNNVTLAQEFENHPVRRNVWASMYALPSFEAANNVFIMNVEAP